MSSTINLEELRIMGCSLPDFAQLIASQARHLTKTGLTHYNLETNEDLILARAMMEVITMMVCLINYLKQNSP